MVRLSFIPVFISATLVFLTGCESTPRPTQTTQEIRVTAPIAQTNDSVFDLIAAAEQASPARANAFRLKAAELALDSRDLIQAQNIVATLNLPVSANLEKLYTLVKARIAILGGDGIDALIWLRSPAITKDPLTQVEQIDIGKLRAQAYAAGRSYLASARERIFVDPLLKGSEQHENQEQIFSALMQLGQANLNIQANKAITSELRGWLSLAAMTKQHQNRPMRQLDALKQWRQVWSSHPAAIRLPARLNSLASVVANQAKTIALFLPLQGDLGAFGRAIRDAIIASKFQLERDVDIHVYDTSNASVETLVKNAATAGAELGIGPLDREKVTQLSSLSLPFPVLALNRTLDGSGHSSLYQFALAPEDEMIQVAEQVFNEGKQNALVVYPEGDWGSRNVTAFQDRWQELGGTTINSATYGGDKDYSTLVKSLLDVDVSEQRALNLRRIIGQSFEFTPRRRQDIDFIFLLANQDQARGINPTLAFFYAEDIPVYSTSHVHQYSDSKIESIDLNGIRFCDIPWKLDSDQPNPIKELWPAARSNLAPFYALGADAFRMYPRLEQLKRFNEERFYGETGELRLAANNIVQRTLSWAQFANGEVVPAPQVVNLASQE